MDLELINASTMITRITMLAYRWFCALEAMAGIMLGGKRRRLALSFDDSFTQNLACLEADGSARSVLVYASTAGELNVVKPILQEYWRRWPDDKLVIFTAYEQYLDLLEKTYPDAVVGMLGFRAPWLIDRFISLTKPRCFIISEGPALHGRFPQRLEVALPAGCLANQVPVFVTNATPHELALPSRVDAIENRFFRRLFDRAITAWFPAYENFEKILLREGAPAERVHRVSDIRFDSSNQAGVPRNAELSGILDKYKNSAAPLFVAGSVNQASEQEMVIKAWHDARASHPDLKLIFAPRYVNEKKTMDVLTGTLEKYHAQFVLRSEWNADDELPDVLIVNVFGELSHYYSIATMSYIGRNHGVLEPIANASPTCVGVGWKKGYSARPLYDFMLSNESLLVAENAAQVTQFLDELIRSPAYRMDLVARATAVINANRGATKRILETIAAQLSS